MSSSGEFDAFGCTLCPPEIYNTWVLYIYMLPYYVKAHLLALLEYAPPNLENALFEVRIDYGSQKSGFL